MGGAIVEILCALFVSIGVIGVVVALANSAWETQDLDTVAQAANAKYRGLWIICEPDSSARVTCWEYKSFFLGLDPKIQAGRGFSIASVFLGLLSFILCTISISAANFSSQNPMIRNRIRLLGSALSFVAGISMIAGVSWYTSVVMTEYYQRQMRDSNIERVVPGEAIYIGFTAGVFLIFGGILGGCISCSGDEEEDIEHPRVIYRPDVSKEYV